MAQQVVHNGGSEKASVDVSFTAVKPRLFVEAPKVDDAVQFYKAAFGAVEINRTTQLKRKSIKDELPVVVSAHLHLAGSTIIVSALSDNSLPFKAGGSGIALCLETEDVEAAVAKAVAAGAVAESEITEDEGACAGSVGNLKDPYGYVWLIWSTSKKSRADVDTRCDTDRSDAESC